MMQKAPTYAVREFTIAPGGSVEVSRSSHFLTALEASAAFKVSFDNAPDTDFEAGLTYNTETGFHRVEIINPSAQALSVKLGFGRGDIKDSRLTLSGQISVAQDAPDTFNTGGPVAAANGAATLLAAQNAFRAEVLLINDGAGKVYIGGDAGAGAGEGLPLEAGSVMVLTTKAAIYGRNDSGAAVDIAVAEMERD